MAFTTTAELHHMPLCLEESDVACKKVLHNGNKSKLQTPTEPTDPAVMYKNSPANGDKSGTQMDTELKDPAMVCNKGLLNGDKAKIQDTGLMCKQSLANGDKPEIQMSIGSKDSELMCKKSLANGNNSELYSMPQDTVTCKKCLANGDKSEVQMPTDIGETAVMYKKNLPIDGSKSTTECGTSTGSLCPTTITKVDQATNTDKVTVTDSASTTTNEERVPLVVEKQPEPFLNHKVEPLVEKRPEDRKSPADEEESCQACTKCCWFLCEFCSIGFP